MKPIKEGYSVFPWVYTRRNFQRVNFGVAVTSDQKLLKGQDVKMIHLTTGIHKDVHLPVDMLCMTPETAKLVVESLKERIEFLDSDFHQWALRKTGRA